MKLISHVDAELQGLNRFFNGKKCKHGHISERYVDNGACVACNAIHSKTYRQKNKEAIAKYQKRYHAENK